MNIPNATYRIQFSPAFGFSDAEKIVDYLSALGVSWIYASPVFQARRNSPHGYDVTDPNRLNPSLGSDAQFEALTARLHEKQMGWLQDAVPNHMAYSGENPLLADLFALGRHSAFAGFFDVRWRHPAAALAGRMAAPFLGEEPEACLEKGQIRPTLRGETLGVAYYEHFFPLRFPSYAILAAGKDGGDLPEASGRRWQAAVRSLCDNADRPPSPDRDRAFLEAKQTLRALAEGDPAVDAFVERRLRRYDPSTGAPDAAGNLKRLLRDQVFHLCRWKTAARQINYRRFFDINELICIRQERSDVFAHTHRLLRRLVEKGAVDGIRVDHVDGLRDPSGYLRRLRSAVGDIYIAVEKILGPGERLRRSWPVEGTSGYEFGDRLTRLFCRPDPDDRLGRIYREFTGRTAPFDEVCRTAKRQVLEEAFAGDLDNLVGVLKKCTERVEDDAPDGDALKRAASELLVGFPVYRSYAAAHGAEGEDAERIRSALKEAAGRRPDLAPVLDDIERVLVDDAGSNGDARADALAGVEQLCAPLAAKGIEDTALYRFFRLASVNEVGGDPDRIGLSPQAFSSFLAERQENWPHAMNAVATHDTKRSGDVRARINVISEMPGEWARRCRRWRDLNRGKKEVCNGSAVPGANTEYLLYQTLLGTFPFDPAPSAEYGERIRRYMVKAAREAKEKTAWLSPDTGYEEALCRFVDRLLFPARTDDPFLSDFTAFAEAVGRCGVYNALAMTLVQLTAPGVPDLYQGNELFDFSLVDPDNRRPVDFARRARLLEEIRSRRQPGPPAAPPGAGAGGAFDRMKLYLVHTALNTRQQMPALFQTGRIAPLAASGRQAGCVFAFARVHGGQYSITAVPRLVSEMVFDGREPVAEAWADTALALPGGFPSGWKSVLGGRRIDARQSLPLAQVFDRFPAALLTGEVNR